MKIRIWVCLIVVFSLMMASTMSQETKSGKKYEYKGETFIVTKLDACEMEVTGKGLTAKIYIHTATNRYRGELNGWGSGHNSLKGALDAACQRILDNASRPSPKELCEGMEDFYKHLGDKAHDSKAK